MTALQQLVGHTQPIQEISWLPANILPSTSALLASSALDRTVRVWDSRKAKVSLCLNFRSDTRCREENGSFLAPILNTAQNKKDGTSYTLMFALGSVILTCDLRMISDLSIPIVNSTDLKQIWSSEGHYKSYHNEKSVPDVVSFHDDLLALEDNTIFGFPPEPITCDEHICNKCTQFESTAPVMCVYRVPNEALMLYGDMNSDVHIMQTVNGIIPVGKCTTFQGDNMLAKGSKLMNPPYPLCLSSCVTGNSTYAWIGCGDGSVHVLSLDEMLKSTQSNEIICESSDTEADVTFIAHEGSACITVALSNDNTSCMTASHGGSITLWNTNSILLDDSQEESLDDGTGAQEVLTFQVCKKGELLNDCKVFWSSGNVIRCGVCTTTAQSDGRYAVSVYAVPK